MLATEWVAPGKGDSAGYLWDLAINSSSLRSSDKREDFLSRGELSDQERVRRTNLSCLHVVPLEEYDIERIIAAIWDPVQR